MTLERCAQKDGVCAKSFTKKKASWSGTPREVGGVNESREARNREHERLPIGVNASQKATERIGGTPSVVFRRETTSRKTSERPPKDSVVVTISPRADAVGLRGTILNSVEGGEEKTSVEVKPHLHHCYLNSREIRLPRTPARREA